MPPLSCAVTVITLEPLCKAMPLAFHVVVPAAVPLPPWSDAQLTCVTVMLSDTVPLRLTLVLEVVKVEAEVGAVMVIAGAAPAESVTESVVLT